MDFLIEQEDKDQYAIELDELGYFLIKPNHEDGYIYLEHYNYDKVLIHKARGKTARNLYLIILDHKWISDLSHAAYLGKELAFAELAIKHNLDYEQR